MTLGTFEAKPVGSQTVETTTVTIASGQSLSGGVDIMGRKLVAILMPSAWTTASMTFQASVDGTNYFDVYDGSSERALVVAANYYSMLNIGDWIGIRYLRVRSGTSGAPVNQGGSRVVTLVVQP